MLSILTLVLHNDAPIKPSYELFTQINAKEIMSPHKRHVEQMQQIDISAGLFSAI